MQARTLAKYSSCSEIEVRMIQHRQLVLIRTIEYHLLRGSADGLQIGS
jgi:hypothetical protein